MNRRHRLLLLAPLAVASCADIFGLGDYTQADAGGDGAEQPDGPPLGDGSSCASPNVCVPPLPSGWTFIAYDQAFRSACSPGYTTPTDVQEDLSAPPATCTCGCTVTPPTCSQLTFTAGTNTTCDNGAKQSVTLSGCTGLGGSVAASGSMSAVVAPAGGSCVPDAGISLTPVSSAYQGRLCELGTGLGGGCDGGSCVPAPAPFLMCVYQAGVVPCPAAYPTQHVVGTSVSDGRGCDVCSCDYDAGACSGSTTFYSTSSCGGPTPQAIAADGGCQSITSATFKSVTFAGGAETPATCAPRVSNPTGDAGFTNPATVCCSAP